MDVQQQIRLEIENIKKGNSKKNIDQLNAILEELRKTLSNKNLPLSFPRIIVDSWDFQDKNIAVNRISYYSKDDVFI